MNNQIYQLPPEFVNKLKKIYPDRFGEIFATFRQRKTTSFRINHLKTDLASLIRKLTDAHVRFQELSFPAGAFLLKGSLREFQNTDVYRQGLVYVQNVSSMIPAIILDPQNDERVLDLCAAPGAKTTQIASLAPQAKIVALDKVRKRYYKLLANLKAQGADNVEVLLLDGIWVRKKFPEYFDKILVDAPCSVEGTFCLPNRHSYKYWKPRKVKEMVRTQKKLLYSSFFALQEEGELVYSTCTFSPEENEEVVDWFIEKFKDKVELLPIEIPLNNAIDGLSRWKNRKFSPQCRLCKRIIPNDFMEGFFIAKIKKVSS